MIHLPEPYTHYSINFATMMQTNINTYFERAVRSVLVSVSPQGKGNHASSPDIDVHTNTEKSEVEHTHTLQPKPKIMSEIEPESIDERESTQNEYSSLVPEHSENLFFDAHCHIHLQIEKAIPYVKSLYEQNRGVAICGTHPEDWLEICTVVCLPTSASFFLCVHCMFSSNPLSTFIHTSTSFLSSREDLLSLKKQFGNVRAGKFHTHHMYESIM